MKRQGQNQPPPLASCLYHSSLQDPWLRLGQKEAYYHLPQLQGLQEAVLSGAGIRAHFRAQVRVLAALLPDAQVCETLQPTWENWMDFLAPAVDLDPAWPLLG